MAAANGEGAAGSSARSSRRTATPMRSSLAGGPGWAVRRARAGAPWQRPRPRRCPPVARPSATPRAARAARRDRPGRRTPPPARTTPRSTPRRGLPGDPSPVCRRRRARASCARRRRSRRRRGSGGRRRSGSAARTATSVSPFAYASAAAAMRSRSPPAPPCQDRAMETSRRRHALALFEPLGPSYDRVGAVLSFGQDPRWRRFLASRIPADGGHVLDVATGTGLVADLLLRDGHRVTGLDQSPAMLAAARARFDGARRARRRRRPSRSRSPTRRSTTSRSPTCSGTWTSRVRCFASSRASSGPEGRSGCSSSRVPRRLARPLWELYVRVGLPLAGRRDLTRLARGGPVPRAVDPRLLARPPRAGAARALGRRGDRRRPRRAASASAAASSSGGRSVRETRVLRPAPRRLARLRQPAAPALHRMAPLVRRRRRVPGAVGAVGPARSHRAGVRARDGRRRTRARRAERTAAGDGDPARDAGGARRRVRRPPRPRIGIVVATRTTLWLLAFIAVGAFLVPAYNLELAGGRFHSDLWFALAWGAFPVLTGYVACAERCVPRRCSRRPGRRCSRSRNGGCRRRCAGCAGTWSTSAARSGWPMAAAEAAHA